MRRNARAFRGLCNVHAWSIHQRGQQSLGLAQAYEDFLHRRIEVLQRAMARNERNARQPWSEWIHAVGGWLRASLPGVWPTRQCPVCRAAQAVERRDLGLLLELITDMEFARVFEASTGLCLPHLNLILRLAPNHSNLPLLVDANLLMVKRLQADLQDFLRRVKAPLLTMTQSERDAIWQRVFEWTVGKSGVFGHERILASEVGVLRRRKAQKSLSPARTGGDGGRMAEVERLSLENAKLQRRLLEVSREWAEDSAQRAALHFQVHKLSEDVKVLGLNLTGARGEAKAGDIQVARLREEIQSLREENRRLKAAQGIPPPGPVG